MPAGLPEGTAIARLLVAKMNVAGNEPLFNHSCHVVEIRRCEDVDGRPGQDLLAQCRTPSEIHNDIDIGAVALKLHLNCRKDISQ